MKTLEEYLEEALTNLPHRKELSQMTVEFDPKLFRKPFSKEEKESLFKTLEENDGSTVL